MNPAFWSGKRVFLTGHTGFKGSWLALWLCRMGAVVHGFALTPVTRQDLFEVARVSEGIEHQIGDVREAGTLLQAMRQFSPDVIFHLAAQSLVRRSYELPVETYAVNVMGTVHVLEAARQVPSVRATIIVTSDKCYDNSETGRAFVETDPMGGRDPYSSSKGSAELATAAYARSFFDPEKSGGSVASVRAGNAIGGGDWAQDRILPDIFRGLLAGNEIVLRNPAAIRPWQHVLEPLSGYLSVAERLMRDGPLPWEAWNFGPNAESEQSVETIARLCCEAWGRPDAFRIVEVPGQAHEAGVLKLDSSKAHRMLGWKPRWNFEETLARCVDWYRRFGAGEDIRAVTLEQIGAYDSLR